MSANHWLSVQLLLHHRYTILTAWLTIAKQRGLLNQCFAVSQDISVKVATHNIRSPSCGQTPMAPRPESTTKCGKQILENGISPYIKLDPYKAITPTSHKVRL